MAANDVQIQIIGKDMASAAFRSVDSAAQGTARSMQSLGGSMNLVNRAISNSAAIAGGIAGYQGLSSAIQSTVGSSMAFAKSMETREIGMAGILVSMAEIGGRTVAWGEALAISKNTIRQLNDEAIRTAATSEELVGAYQALLGPGLAAKMNMGEILQLTVAGTNAVKSLGLDNRQVIQELRDLVAGGIQPASSTLATALGLKDSDIKAAKESSEGLFKFLMDRLKGFDVSSGAYAQTWQGITEQIQEGITRAGATGMEPLFAAAKRELAAVAGSIVLVNEETKKIEINPEVIGVFRTIADTTLFIGQHAKEAAIAFVAWKSLSNVALVMRDIQAVTVGAATAQTMLGRAVLSSRSAYAEKAAIANAAAASELAAAKGASAVIIAVERQRAIEKKNAAIVTAGILKAEADGNYVLAAQLRNLQAEYIKLGISSRDAGLMQLQAAEMARKGNYLLATQLMATQTAHLSTMAAANKSATTTVTAMGVAGTATRNMLSTVWALAGGWIGVAVATGYAINALINYEKNKNRIDSYNSKAEVFEENGKLYKNTLTTEDVADGVGGTYAVQARKKVELSPEEYKRHFDWKKQQEELENYDSEAERKKFEELMKQIGAKFPGSSDGKAAEKAYEEAQRLTDKIADMLAKMDNDIRAKTDTAYQSSTGKLTSETDNIKRELEKRKLDFAKYGIDVSSVYDKITEYHEKMTAEFEKTRSRAFSGLTIETGGIRSDRTGDLAGQAEAEYQATMLRLEKQKEEEFKKIAKSKDDAEAQKAVDDWYTEQYLLALQKRTNGFRDAKLQEYDIALQHNSLLVTLEGASTTAVDSMNKRLLDSKIKYLEAEVIAAGGNKQKQLELMDELADAMEKRNNILGRNMVTAYDEATRRIEARTIDYADYFVQAHDNISDTMQSSFKGMMTGAETFSSGMKNIFKSMIDEIADMMVKMWYQQAIINPVANWWSGVLGGVFGGGSTAAASTLDMSKYGTTSLGVAYPSFGGNKAAGGSVEVGKLYRVNEPWGPYGGGTELFQPSVSGRIFPANSQKNSGSTVQNSFSFSPTFNISENNPVDDTMRQMDNYYETVVRPKVMQDLETNSGMRRAAKKAVS